MSTWNNTSFTEFWWDINATDDGYIKTYRFAGGGFSISFGTNRAEMSLNDCKYQILENYKDHPGWFNIYFQTFRSQNYFQKLILAEFCGHTVGYFLSSVTSATFLQSWRSIFTKWLLINTWTVIKVSALLADLHNIWTYWGYYKLF